MTTDSRTEVHQAGRIMALWTGILLAPAAFLTNLELGYILVYPSCARDSSLPVHLAHAVCFAAALAGALVAWREWRAEGTLWPGETGGPKGRSQLMGGVGAIGSLFFALVIVAQWIPVFGLHPCQ
jgi:hypothetical protein